MYHTVHKYHTSYDLCLMYFRLILTAKSLPVQTDLELVQYVKCFRIIIILQGSKKKKKKLLSDGRVSV